LTLSKKKPRKGDEPFDKPAGTSSRSEKNPRKRRKNKKSCRPSNVKNRKEGQKNDNIHQIPCLKLVLTLFLRI
jgi:hypothetical protein